MKILALLSITKISLFQKLEHFSIIQNFFVLSETWYNYSFEHLSWTFQIFYFIIIKGIEKFCFLHLICFTNFHIPMNKKCKNYVASSGI